MRVPVCESRPVWFELPAGSKGGHMWAFLSVFPDVQQREKEVVGLENCQQSNIRNGVRLFITLELQWITLVIKILRSDSVVDLMIDYFVYSPTHRSTCLKK